MKSVILMSCLTLSLFACGDASTVNTKGDSSHVETKENNLSQINLHVEGMTCKGCENAIKRALKKRDGIISVDASHVNENVVVSFDVSKISSSDIKEAIIQLGYEVK